jgi:hypothetical protein
MKAILREHWTTIAVSFMSVLSVYQYPDRRMNWFLLGLMTANAAYIIDKEIRKRLSVKKSASPTA